MMTIFYFLLYGGAGWNDVKNATEHKVTVNQVKSSHMSHGRSSQSHDNDDLNNTFNMQYTY